MDFQAKALVEVTMSGKQKKATEPYWSDSGNRRGNSRRIEAQRNRRENIFRKKFDIWLHVGIMSPGWLQRGITLTTESCNMPELNTTKHTQEEAHPILSLNQGKTKCETKDEKEAQEALWNRSLEFFNTMNVAKSHS